MINAISNNNIYNYPIYRGKIKAKPVVQKLTNENLSDVFPLYVKYRESAGVKSSIEEVKEYLTQETQRAGDEIFLSKKENIPVGFLHFGKEYSTLRPDFRYRIKALFVETAQRGLGIAKALLEAMQNYAQGKEIVVKARKANPNSPHLYKHYGFEEDPNFIHFVFNKK